MKKVLLLLTIIIAFAACKKDDINRGISGTWELRTVVGGWGVDQNFDPGNGTKYEFKPGNLFTKYMEGKFESAGTYRIQISSNENGYDSGSIHFSQPDYTDAFRMKKDTIIIGSGAADGPVYIYLKVK